MEITIYYVFLTSVILSFHLRKTSKHLAVFIAALSFFCLLAAPALSEIRALTSTTTSVSVLDVGHGSAVVLQLPHSKTILIDGGGATGDNFNIGERVIGPFLWKKRVSRLDSVVISHPHADHYNGLAFILSNFHPQVLWVNGTTGDDPEYSKLLDLAERLNIEIRIPRTDEVLFQDNSTRLQCVQNGAQQKYTVPPKLLGSPKPDTNDMSLVLRLETADNSFLFPADISAAMADSLVSAKKNIEADILLAPHHGSRLSMSLNFIETVDPQYIAVSVGRNNPFNFPDRSFLDLEQKGIRIVTTERDGTLTFTAKAGETKMGRYQIN
jgi:competence protein ComEC